MSDKKDVESFGESSRVPETFSFSESENQKAFLNEDFVFKFEDNQNQTGIDSNSFDLGVEDNKTKPSKDDLNDEIKKAANEQSAGESSETSASSSSTSSSSTSSGSASSASSGASSTVSTAASAGASSTVAAVAATATTAVVLVVGGGLALSNQTLKKPTVCQFDYIEVIDNSVSYSLFLGTDNPEDEANAKECNVYIGLFLPNQDEPVQEQQIFTFGNVENSFEGLEYDTEYLLKLSQHVVIDDQDGVLPGDYQQFIDDLDLFRREFLAFSFDGEEGADFYRFRTAPSQKFFTVTWVDYDGTILELDENVLEGEMPSYDGDTPTRSKENHTSYTFGGWTPEISEVTEDVTYTATYSATNYYTVRWENYDGELLELDENVLEGTTPSYDGDTPTRSKDGNYSYEFSGWTPTISEVTEDITYTATYKSTKLYTVRWVNYDGELLELDENVLEGTTPSYDGTTPTRNSDDDYIYTFSGWSPDVTTVTANITYTATYKEASRYSFNVYKEVDPMGGETYSVQVIPNSEENIPQYENYFIGLTPVRQIDGAYSDEPLETNYEWYYVIDYDVNLNEPQILYISGNQLTDRQYVIGLIGRNPETEEDVVIYSTTIDASAFISSNAPTDAIYFERVINNNNIESPVSYYGYFSYSGEDEISNINGVLSNPADVTGSVVAEFGLSMANNKEETTIYFGNNDEYIVYNVTLEYTLNNERVSVSYAVDFNNIPTVYSNEPYLENAFLSLVGSSSGKYAAIFFDISLHDYDNVWNDDLYSVQLIQKEDEEQTKVFNSTVAKCPYGIEERYYLEDITTDDIQNYFGEFEWEYSLYYDEELVYGPATTEFLDGFSTLDGSFNLFYAMGAEQSDSNPLAFEVFCEDYTNTSEFKAFELYFENAEEPSDNFTQTISSFNKKIKTSLTSNDFDRNSPNYYVTVKGIRTDGSSKVIYTEEVDMTTLDTQEWTEPTFNFATFNFEASQSGITEYMLVDLTYHDPANEWNEITNFNITITNIQDSSESYTSVVSPLPFGMEEKYFLPQFNATALREILLNSPESYVYSVYYDGVLVSDEALSFAGSASIADASVNVSWAQSPGSDEYVLQVTSNLDTEQEYYQTIYRIMLVVEDVDETKQDRYSQKFEMWMSGGMNSFEQLISDITQEMYANAEFSFEVRAYYDQTWDEDYFNDPSNYTVMYREVIDFSNL